MHRHEFASFKTKLLFSASHTLTPEYYYSFIFIPRNSLVIWIVVYLTAICACSRFSVIFLSIHLSEFDLCSSVWWSFPPHLYLCCSWLLLFRKTSLTFLHLRGGFSILSFFRVFQNISRNINNRRSSFLRINTIHGCFQEGNCG